MAPVEGRNVRSMFLTSCLAVIFGRKTLNMDLQQFLMVEKKRASVFCVIKFLVIIF